MPSRTADFEPPDAMSRQIQIWTAGTAALRGVRRAKRFVAAATLLLASGLSASTITFAIVDSVVLRPLPFDDEERLVALYFTRRDTQGRHPAAPQDVAMWQTADAFESVAALRTSLDRLIVGSTADEVRAAEVTSNIFATLRRSPVLGSIFPDRVDKPTQIVISHALWRRRFGSAADVVGRSVVFRDAPATVAAVMPEGFTYPLDVHPAVDIWVPYVITPGERTYSAAGGRTSTLDVIARRRSGVSLEMARQQINAQTTQLAAAHPSFYAGLRVQLEPLRETLIGAARHWMLLVLVAVICIAGVTAFNVSNMFLTRTLGRWKEFAIRRALGADALHVFLVVIGEGLVIGCLSLLLSLGLSVSLGRTAKALVPSDVFRASASSIDARVIVVAAAATLLVSLLISIGPALRAAGASTSLAAHPKTAGSWVLRRWRSIALIGELAFATTILTIMAVVVTSFMRVLAVDLGINRDNLVAVKIFPNTHELRGNDAAKYLQDLMLTLTQAVSSVPGVAGVAVMNGGGLPLYGGSARTLLRRPGGADAVRVEFRGVTSNFFQVAGIAIERGRPFDGSDTASSQPVILIDELVAAQLLNDGEPVNAMLISGSTAFRVKGVVSSVRMAGPTNEPVPMMYQPLSQRGSGGHQLLIRTAVPAGHAVPRIAEVVSSVMPGTAAPAQVSVVEDQFARMILFRRVAASVMSVFGAIAFVLAFVGVFAVVSTTVAERTREIAIRVALGASRPRILLSQLKVWTGIAVGGIGVGVLGALAMLQLFRPVMFQVDLLDVSPYLAPMIAMIVATLVGTLGPALRATRIDPAITLRE